MFLIFTCYIICNVETILFPSSPVAVSSSVSLLLSASQIQKWNYKWKSYINFFPVLAFFLFICIYTYSNFLCFTWKKILTHTVRVLIAFWHEKKHNALFKKQKSVQLFIEKKKITFLFRSWYYIHLLFQAK